MLSDVQCRKVEAGARKMKLPDAQGLYLLVTPTGFKGWRFKYRFAGKEKLLTFGAYPEISLKRARERRDEARRLLAEGIDPAMAKKQAEAARRAKADATVQSIAEDWLEDQRPTWAPRYAQTVERALRRDIFPQLGRLPIADITRPMVIERLKAIEARGAIETAKRIRQNLSFIFDHAIGSGHMIENPAAARIALKPLVQEKRPAITQLQALRAMLFKIEGVRAHPVTKLASRFIALTAMRPGVVQEAPWTELRDLDPDDPLWIVPAARMKLRLERKKQQAFDHWVPLSRQAVELLRTLELLTGTGHYAFPKMRTGARPMSDSTLSKLYRENGFRDVHVPHGWRAAFSTIMNERAAARDIRGDREIIDMMLAHQQDGVEPIYNRSAYMQRRREIAQEWADLLLDGFPPASSILTSPRN